eukprot:gene4758-5818_t
MVLHLGSVAHRNRVAAVEEEEEEEEEEDLERIRTAKLCNPFEKVAACPHSGISAMISCYEVANLIGGLIDATKIDVMITDASPTIENLIVGAARVL